MGKGRIRPVKIAPSNFMHFVYILSSKKDKGIYIGFTNNIKRRLLEHNTKKDQWTSRKKPWELVYCEIYKSSEDAKEREESLKLHARALAQLKRRISRSLGN